MATETLRIKLTVDGAAAAVADTQRVEKGILTLSGTAERITQRFRGLGLAVGGFATGGLAVLIKGSIDSADQLSKLSDRLGATVEGLSRMEFAAERSGVAFGQMTTALQRQTRRIAEASQGTGEAVKALQELGLSVEKLRQLTPEQQFLVLADSLSGVANAGDRVRLAMKFWDTEGVQMLQIANGGSIAVRQLWEESDRLGRTMDDKTARAAAQLNDAITNLQSVMLGWWNTALKPIITTLNDIASGIDLVARSVGLLSNDLSTLSSSQLRTEMVGLQREMDRIRELYQQASDEADKAAGTEWGKATQERAEALRDEYDKLSEQWQQLSDSQVRMTATTTQTSEATDRYFRTMESAAGNVGKLRVATRELDDSMADWERTLMDVNASAEDIFAALDAQEIERINEAWSKAQLEMPKAAKEASHAASVEIRQEMDPTAEWMAQSLTDAIMRGFENGQGIVRNFIETLKNWFATLVLRPVIQATVTGAMGMVGMGGAGGATAGGLGSPGGISSFGSLFGGGGSMSGMLNSGARAMGWNPAGAAGRTQLFGGTGMGYGLAGLGGGLIGTYVGNGSTASTMGGSIGGMVGYGVGAGSAFAGTAMGMQLGMFAGPVGALVGALVGTLIGSLLSGNGGDKTPDLQVTPTGESFGNVEIRPTQSGGTNIQRWITESPFGNLRWRTGHDAFRSEADAQQFAQTLSGVASIETALGKMVGPDMSGAIAEAISQSMGDGLKKLAENPDEWEQGLEAFFAERFTIAFDLIGGNMERVFSSIEGGSAEAAGATIDLFTALRTLGDVSTIYTALVEEQGRSLYEAQQLQLDSLRELIFAYEGGLEATQALTGALAEQAQLQVQLLAQIDQAMSDIDTTLSGTIESLRLRLFDTDQQRYDYLRAQAEALSAGLGSITDPETLVATVRQIDALTRQGIGLLSEEQLRAGMGQELIDYLAQVQDTARSQGEQTRADILAQGEILVQQADAAMQQVEAARVQQVAAQSFAQSVSQFAAAASSRGQAIPSSGVLSLRPL